MSDDDILTNFLIGIADGDTEWLIDCANVITVSPTWQGEWHDPLRETLREGLISYFDERYPRAPRRRW